MQGAEGARSSPGPGGFKPAVTNGHGAQAGDTPWGCGKELVAVGAPAGLPALPRKSKITLGLGCCFQRTTVV